jgi:hypothetical protein
MTYEWVPLLGEFETSGTKLTFIGQTYDWPGENEPRTIVSIGNALVPVRFTGGTISATVAFQEVDHTTVCEVIIYHDTATGFLITAGIGGGWHMFSVRQYDGKVWTMHAGTGDRRNLNPDQKYRIRVNVSGSRIVVSVNGVNVAAATLPYRIPESQVGIWCQSHARVTITDFTVETQRPKAFVVMQFTSPYNEVYADVIRSICQELGMDVVRADEEYGPGVIISDLSRQIIESTVIIADITPSNPNVYYEVGYAHALSKPTILIAEKGTQLPFDVSPFRTLFYENTINGKAKLEDGLKKHLMAILSETSPSTAMP